MTDDSELLAKLRRDGLCVALSPALVDHVRPYACCLDVGHSGAHVARIGDQVIDTWPQ